MNIYLAHPISGLSGAEILDYYSKMKEELCPLGFTVLSPMTGKEYLRNTPKYKAHGYDEPLITNHAIFERDLWMVSQADIVLVDLRETSQVSIGCVMELAIASYQRKHTIVVVPKDNIHQHAFVLEAADIVFDTMEEALKYLADLCLGR